MSPFWIQEHPVTNEEYERRSQSFAANGKEQHPVVQVSWGSARAYSSWLGGRLPTEAEWEYACRAGTDTTFWSGDSEEDLARVGWYYANSGGHSHPVCEKPANPWGLSDMHGNVCEWVTDWWNRSEYSRRVRDNRAGGAVENPKGPAHGKRRAIRGGSFRSGASSARSTYRSKAGSENWDQHLGFRVVFDAAPSDKKD